MTDIETYMLELGKQARAASREIGRATTAQKNSALLAIAKAIDSNRQGLLDANGADLKAGVEKGLNAALMDRANI